MTRVRKAAAVGLMTPVAATAIAIGLSQSAHAAEACPPLGNATITAPTNAVTAGSSVHVSAKISGLMLLQAHLQISGPGLDKQVGKSVLTGQIQGDVTVPQAGYFTLAVVGNGTKCAYQTKGFSVKEVPVAAKPTHGASASKTPSVGGGNGASPNAGAGSLPTGSLGNGATVSPGYGLDPLNGASPFSLPSVAPDGSGLGFDYPSPDPQVASPPSRPVARNVSETTPIKWGQSLAVALVLLVISAHLGMWSRRQRLAAEGARTGGGGRWTTRKKAEKPTAAMAATGLLTKPATGDDAQVETRRNTSGAADTAAASEAIGASEPAGTTEPAETVGTTGSAGTIGTTGTAGASRVAEAVGTTTDGEGADTAATLDLGKSAELSQAPHGTSASDQAEPDEETGPDESDKTGSHRRASGRNYHGRRRRD